ncbi:MAG: MBL fold metallo-hydrolase [Gudongella sp.]|nr:MBL fold metallo-hydrolase [Gudongella sp.]
MKIHIHRGQQQIGGSIIEIASSLNRIFLDVGVNLNQDSNVVIPKIEGVFSGKKDCDAVFISHYHSDHMGLLPSLIEDIPVYMGEKAYKVYEASANYRGKNIGFSPNFIYDKETVVVGDISLTPFLCDHSAFDSYMFLIKVDNKTVLYTGDFRANGRLDFTKLLSALPKVDAIIIEGTTLSRETARKNIEEQQLEDIATNYLKSHNGPAFIMMSAMNVERIVTAHNVAKKTNRIFLDDIYTADIVMSAGNFAPKPNVDGGIRVFTTGGEEQYERLIQYGDAKIGKYEIAKTPFLMCIRQSMRDYLIKLNELVSFNNGVLFYGMWKGYMEQLELQEFLSFMQDKGLKLHILHTSGHADEMTIDKLIREVCPKVIIPVHTENEKWFDKYSDTSEIIYGKNIIEI